MEWTPGNDQKRDRGFHEPEKETGSDDDSYASFTSGKEEFCFCKEGGKANLYSALVTQEEYQQQEGKHVLEKLYDNSLKNFVATLYQGKQIDQNDIEELESFLQELK